MSTMCELNVGGSSEISQWTPALASLEKTSVQNDFTVYVASEIHGSGYRFVGGVFIHISIWKITVCFIHA